jgi:hypothetical protein
MTVHELCDDILKLCSTNMQLSYTFSLQKKYETNGISVNQLEGILKHLSDNPPAYLNKHGDVYVLTPAGKYFLDCGGYAGQIQRENEEKQIKQEQQKLVNEVNKSVLETNVSVRKTRTLQIITMVVTAIVAVCAFLISLFSYLRNDEKLPILLLQRQQVQTQKELDSLKFLLSTKISPDTVQIKHP